MAEGGDRTFENPTYEDPYSWDDDDYGDRTTPSFQHPQRPLAKRRLV